MVKKIKGNYQCEDCNLLYEDKHWAQECEKWCLEHKSCNLAITSHSISVKAT